MQAHAPNASSVPPAAKQARPATRLYQMLPGLLFRAAAGSGDSVPAVARRGVLALLTHGGAAVSDNTKIWCAVISAEPHDGLPGEFIGLPRDTPVERLHVLGTLRLACEH